MPLLPLQGLDTQAASALFAGVAVSLAFLAIVFFLDSRPDLVLKIMRRKLLEDPTNGLF